MPELHQVMSLKLYGGVADLRGTVCTHPSNPYANSQGAISGRTSQADKDDWLTIYCPNCGSDNTFNLPVNCWWCASCLVEFEFRVLSCPICESVMLTVEGVNGVSVSYPPSSSDRGDTTPNFRIVCHSCSAVWGKDETEQLLEMLNLGVQHGS